MINVFLKILSEDFRGGFELRNSCLTSAARSLNFEEIEDLESNKTFISRDFLVLFHLGKSTVMFMAGKESIDMFAFHRNRGFRIFIKHLSVLIFRALLHQVVTANGCGNPDFSSGTKVYNISIL
jgi:hypothetical protein